jgi:hypothetical protein
MTGAGSGICSAKDVLVDNGDGSDGEYGPEIDRVRECVVPNDVRNGDTGYAVRYGPAEGGPEMFSGNPEMDAFRWCRVRVGEEERSGMEFESSGGVTTTSDSSPSPAELLRRSVRERKALSS